MSALTLNLKRRPKQLISITALIDVVFILLLFFMLTSTFLKWRTLTLETTSLDGATEQTAPPVTVILYEDGTTQMHHAHSSSGKLNAQRTLEYIQALPLAEKANTFVIQSEPRVTTQRIITMFDALKTNHITHFTLGDLYMADTH